MKNGVHVATIMKRYEGALKMMFPQADTFTVEFHDTSLSLEEIHPTWNNLLNRFRLFRTALMLTRMDCNNESR